MFLLYSAGGTRNQKGAKGGTPFSALPSYWTLHIPIMVQDTHTAHRTYAQGQGYASL